MSNRSSVIQAQGADRGDRARIEPQLPGGFRASIFCGLTAMRQVIMPDAIRIVPARTDSRTRAERRVARTLKTTFDQLLVRRGLDAKE